MCLRLLHPLPLYLGCCGGGDHQGLVWGLLPPGPQATLGLVDRAGATWGVLWRGTEGGPCPPEAILHPEGWGWLAQGTDSLVPGQVRVHGPGGDARRMGFLGPGGNVGWQVMAP